MSEITWDQQGEREYETGVDHGVLYIPDAQGAYSNGVAWNGLTTVTESPSGAESNKQYADNQVYLNLISAEEFNATVEAFMYPEEFSQFDGSAEPAAGISIGQQRRGAFGLAYRTLKGNDVLGTDHGYKLHLVYGCQAAPSEKAYATVNDSPEAITFSWELSTTPVAVGTVNGTAYRPTATLTVDSTKVDAATLTELETILYGSDPGVDPATDPGASPRLPLPREIIQMFAGTV